MHLVLVGFCPAHDQPAAKEFFVVQFLHGAFRFLDGLHLHKGKTLRTLIMAIAHDLGVLHVPDAVEQFEKIALSSVDGKIANVTLAWMPIPGSAKLWASTINGAAIRTRLHCAG